MRTRLGHRRGTEYEFTVESKRVIKHVKRHQIKHEHLYDADKTPPADYLQSFLRSAEFPPQRVSSTASKKNLFPRFNNSYKNCDLMLQQKFDSVEGFQAPLWVQKPK